MVQDQERRVRADACNFDPLAAELAKIPQERQEQVRHDAAIFVAGMEAAARVQQTVRPGA